MPLSQGIGARGRIQSNLLQGNRQYIIPSVRTPLVYSDPYSYQASHADSTYNYYNRYITYYIFQDQVRAIHQVYQEKGRAYRLPNGSILLLLLILSLVLYNSFARPIRYLVSR